MIPWKEIGFRTLNFTIFVAILYKVAKGRMVVYLRARRQRVEQELDQARQIRAEAERLKEEWERKLAALREEREELLQRESERAQADAERILEEARRTAERILEEARRTAEREAASLREQLIDELLKRSIALAEDSLRRTLKPADHRRLLEEYLVNMEGLLRC